MFELDFEINGLRVRPDQIGNALEKTVLEDVVNSVRKAVGSLRCPVHGGSPRILGKGRSAEHLNFEVTGCCDRLVKLVEEKLK